MGGESKTPTSFNLIGAGKTRKFSTTLDQISLMSDVGSSVLLTRVTVHLGFLFVLTNVTVCAGL
jgi:preprotein translocase subunit SecG